MGKYDNYTSDKLIEKILSLEREQERDQQTIRDHGQMMRDQQTEFESLRQAYNRVMAQSQGRVYGAVAPPQPVAPTPAPPAPVVFVGPAQYEEAMVATLNEWWEYSVPERQQLLEMLRLLGVPARFYTMNAIEAVMQSVSWNGPYSFQPSEKDGGWLLCELKPGGDALLLPADPKFFDTDPMRKILERIVVGCENVYAKPLFRSASNACHLARSQEKEGSYRINGKGVVWLDGYPKPPSFGTQVRSFKSFFEKPTARQSPTVLPSASSPQLPAKSEELLLAIDGHLDGLLEDTKKIKAEMAEIKKKLDRVSSEIEKIKSVPLAAQPVPRPAEVTIEAPPCAPLPKDALKRAYEVAEPAAQSDYPARLQGLQQALKSEFQDLPFEISHLSLQSGRFAIHAARIEESNSIACEICGRNLGDRQFFLTASAGQSSSVWALLPPGDLKKFDFPNGYGLLLDPAPPGVFNVESVSYPALLHLIEPREGLFQVTQKMVWAASQS